MKKCFTLTLFVLGLLLGQQVPAQKKNVPGYYINLQGDTVRGVFSGYAEWSRNPQEVAFASSATAGEVILTPVNTRKFVMDGYDEYLSYSGQRMLNPIDDAELIRDRTYSSFADEFTPITAFLRLAVRTKGLDLYVLNDGKRLNLYYQLPGQAVTELRYKKYMDQDRISEIPEYKQQLNNLFAPAIEQQRLTGELERLAYKEEDMETFFEHLFPDKQAKGKIRNPATGWFLSAGASVTTILVNGDKSYDPVSKSYSTSVSPLLAIGYYLPLQRNFGKYFFFPQARLFRYKSIGESNDGTWIRTTEYKTDLVATGEVQGGVNLVNTEKMRIFLAGGAGLVFQVNGTEVHNSYAASNRSLYASSTAPLSPITYTINAAAGLVLNKKVMVSATYLLPSLASLNPFYTVQLTGVQLRVGYRLE